MTVQSLLAGVTYLVGTDRDLGRVVRRIGPPPLWARRPGFATLLRIVLEQQVSLASARATYTRLQQALGRITPKQVAGQSVADLRRHGITRQKAEYCRGLAVEVLAGTLDLARIERCDDEAARQGLIGVRGVGPWTADVYLLMALRRRDVWPDGDLALAEAARQVKGLRRRPSTDRLRRIAANWRPWRSVAARILWHHYLSERRNEKT